MDPVPASVGNPPELLDVDVDHVAGACPLVADEWLAQIGATHIQVHRTHGQQISVAAARDRAALRPLPSHPYVVCDRHLRVVGKDALVSFERSLYSVPWRDVRPGCRVELRARPDRIEIHSIGKDPRLLAAHPRAKTKGSFITDEAHWEGLPDGRRGRGAEETTAVAPLPLATPVGRRSPAFYDRIFATGGAR